MRKSKKTAEDQKAQVLRNRYNIGEAKSRLDSSAVGYLLAKVKVEEVGSLSSPPSIGAADPVRATIYLNPFHLRKGASVSIDEWSFVIAHLLLHLGLNHAARREDRAPLLWNKACDHVIDRVLQSLRIGVSSDCCPWDCDASEETIYDELARRVAVEKIGPLPTLAGISRPDILGLDHATAFRQDYEELFAAGIRRAAEEAIAAVAESLDVSTETLWPPAERAKRWVLSEFPLLGALAAEMRVIARSDVCERMSIPVAAVNAFLGEMYLHPGCGFTDAEVRFVYVHELLHVALQHHTRTRGRDPYLWNLATDFVINGWIVEMGIGRLPNIGGLYDPRLTGMNAEEVYDLILRNPRDWKGARGFRGGLGDILLDAPGRRIYKDDVTTLDDIYRRCLATGLACAAGGGPGRGTIPAALMEEIQTLFTPPVPWDVELARWMDQHVPLPRVWRRSYARASRRQASTPDISRPARYIPREVLDACTFGVVLDTSGSMDRILLGRALGAIASYAEARDVPAVRLVLCDAAPYDRGFVAPTDLRGVFAIQGRGGTVLQPAVSYLLGRGDFPAGAPIMILTDGWCEEEILCPREHCFVLPRKSEDFRNPPLRTGAPVFRVLKEESY